MASLGYGASCTTPTLPCERYHHARVIFEGFISQLLDAKGYRARLVAGGAYKGLPPPLVEAWSDEVRFAVGDAYLVYGRTDSDKLSLFCSGSALLSERAPDLEFLRTLDVRPPVATISGNVFLPTMPEDRAAQMVRETVVTITGPVDRTTGIDQQGRFQLREMAPGEYRLEGRSGVLETSKPIRVSVEAYGCAGVELTLAGTVGLKRIRGRLVDRDGHPARDLIEIEPVYSDAYGTLVRPESDGSFETEKLMAGRYRLGFNLGLNPQQSEPYPRTYHPGVSDAANAAEIEIGEHLPEPDLLVTAPRMRPRVSIQGTVLLGNGKAASETDLYLRPVPGHSTAQKWPNTRGEFRFETFGETDYSLEVRPRDPRLKPVTMLLRAGELENKRIIVLR